MSIAYYYCVNLTVLFGFLLPGFESFLWRVDRRRLFQMLVGLSSKVVITLLKLDDSAGLEVHYCQSR